MVFKIAKLAFNLKKLILWKTRKLNGIFLRYYFCFRLCIMYTHKEIRGIR